MADFCKQCSIDHFGEDHRDLAGLGNGRTLQPNHGWLAICEGCGYILVDDDGNCFECDLKPGQPGHGKALSDGPEEGEPTKDWTCNDPGKI